MPFRFFRLLIFVLATACGIAACTSSATDERRSITVSIAPLRYVVTQLAGDRFVVNVLTPDGASPEAYQLTPRQLTELNESQLYVRVGTLGFERTLLEQIAGNVSHLVCVEASRGIRGIDRGHSGHSDSGDPHTWTSPANMRIIATNVCQALAAIDTANAPTYFSNLQRFSAHLDSLDARLRQLIATAPTRAFLIYHPALAYFAESYGLRQLSVERDGKSPSADHLARLVDTCRSEGVKVVFVQKEHSGGAARSIAQEIGAQVVEINPLSEDWEGEMLRIATALSGQRGKED